ncbi:olfactory receptor 11L1-like [Rhinoderma darwinii]|uniref:olfactory receptor 11L1-like n=1 Tax=Rhinoderma darwinii TaxID=43563 RepID=UPI003F661BB4
MEKNNITTILLLGFPGLHNFQTVFFLLLLTIYCLTICGNLLVITLVSYSKNLHSPMYFFLTQLATLDIIVTSDIVPNMLLVVLHSGSSMTLPGCFTQLFFFGSSEASECLILTVMSYDRYLAICYPLNYYYIMNPMICLKFTIISWLIGFSVTLTLTVTAFQAHICESNVIDHFYCDFESILELLCSNLLIMKTLELIFGFPVLVAPFLIVVMSYAYIIHTIFRIQSPISRQKAFSTCGSHLTVVSIFYGTLVSIYLSPEKAKSITLRKIISIVYTVVTPLTNPVIYCLRNEDIKEAFRKIYLW